MIWLANYPVLTNENRLALASSALLLRAPKARKSRKKDIEAVFFPVVSAKTSSRHETSSLSHKIALGVEN